MTDFAKNLLHLILAVVLLGLAYSLYTARVQLSGTKAQLATSEANVKALKANAAASEAAIQERDRLRAQIAARSTAQTKELTHAYQANPDWADAVVPDAVWDGVFHPGAAPEAPASSGTAG